MPALGSVWVDTSDGIVWTVDRVDERGVLLLSALGERALVSLRLWPAPWLVPA